MFQFDRIEPCTGLKDVVKSFWFIEKTDTTTQPLYLIPDGFPEIVFYTNKHLSFIDKQGGRDTYGEPSFCGQLTHTKVLDAPVGTHAVFVKLYPWAALNLFTNEEYNHLDRSVPLSCLFPHREVREIESRIEDCLSKKAICRLIEDFLMLKILDLNGPGSIFRHLVKKMLLSAGAVNIDDVLQGVRCSRRYIEKIFSVSMGLSPGKYMRTLRVKEVSRKLSTGTYANLSQTAIEHDYFDQSHFNRDFYNNTGFSPSHFIRYMKDFPIVQKSKYLDQFDHVSGTVQYL